MEYLLVLVPLIILGLAHYTTWLDKPKANYRTWLDNISKTREDSGFRARIHGHKVVLRPEMNLIEIEAPLEFPGGLVIKPAPGLFSEALEPSSESHAPLETGDPIFDGNFMVWGEPWVIGLLDVQARSDIMRLGIEGLTPQYVARLYGQEHKISTIQRKKLDILVSRNKLSLVEIHENQIVLRWQRRARQLGDWVNLSRHLLREGSKMDLLLHNCRQEEGMVRLLNLRVLAHEMVAEHEAIRDQVRLLLPLVDRVEEKLLIYLILGPANYEEALRVLAATENFDGLEKLVIPMAADLARSHSRNFLAELAGNPGNVGNVALTELARFADAEAGNRIREIFRNSTDSHRQAAAIQAMASLGPLVDTGFLLNQLLEGGLEVRIAAARTLGSCGNFSVIEPMALERERTRGPLRQALEEAIKQIQSGLGEVESGWLTVRKITSPEGALSIKNPAPAEGMLSLPRQENPKDGGSQP